MGAVFGPQFLFQLTLRRKSAKNYPLWKLEYLREAIQKNGSLFWTLSKRGHDPTPLILDIREVTFLSANFGQP